MRRCRKSLLSELSSLVKTAKRLQDSQQGTLRPVENVNDIVDEMILRAFKIITKGVRFLDVLEEERRARAPAVAVMATVMEESSIPPTPPADQATFLERTQSIDVGRYDAGIHGTADGSGDVVGTPSQPMEVTGVPSQPQQPTEMAQTAVASSGKRVSSIFSPTSNASHRLSQGASPSRRLSSNMAHRVSLAGPSPLSRPSHLVSERLSKTHDTLLSQLGQFIGRLQLQSRSRSELIRAIKESATSGGELLAVVDVVCDHNPLCAEILEVVRCALFDRISELVSAGQEILSHAVEHDADVVMPEHTCMLSTAATGCVKAAGECVEKTCSVIWRIGDFEFELEKYPAGIDVSVLDVLPEEGRRSIASSDRVMADAVSITESSRSSRSSEPAQSLYRESQRLTIIPCDKPLPEVPAVTSPSEEQFNGGPQYADQPHQQPQEYSPCASRPSSSGDENTSSMASSVASLRHTLPPLPKISTSLLGNNEDYVCDDPSAVDGEYQHSSRMDSMTASSAGSGSTFLSRDSESSLISQSSTRATTPDYTLFPRSQPSLGELSASGSAATSHTEEVDDVESKLLEKTYAHELVFNKEGQVTGGSLPALVERLTTHESTPDAMFVSTFYLTFRLFCSPLGLAESLVDRFNYVGDSPHMAGPVRLRVYNVFKGWLESHWRDETDRYALNIIVPFAEHGLGMVLPSAGRRLLELAERVSSEGSLVPRLVSSMGKTNTAIAQFIPADTPLPAPVISKGQLQSLHQFAVGGSTPTIMDFEPLELARQLTLKQMGIFCSILPEELLASQWMKNGGANAPNVKAMSSFSTDLSNLVADSVLAQTEVKKRAAIIKQWIKIAHQCYDLHNYDGLMAIICSLNSSTISRLRRTWESVSPRRREMLRTLQGIVEPAQNHKILRGKLHDHVPPCLPFLGMYLTDLTFVDIGNASTKPLHALGHEGDEETDGITIVNFDKHNRTAKIIGELQRFQIPYRLTEIPEMQDWMTRQVTRVRENDGGNVQVNYYRRSLLLEPRELAIRTPIEVPVPTPSPAPRENLFGWMSRGGDRSGAATPAPI